MTDQNKTPEQEAAEKAAAAAAAAEAKKAEKAAAKAAKDAAAAEAKAKKEAEKAAKKAEKEAAAKAKADEKAAKEAAKAEAKAAKEASKQVKQNGIALPKEGTIGHTLFTIFNEQSSKMGQPCDITSVIPLAEAKGVCLASIRAGYAKWKKFHGLSGRITAPAPAGADAGTAAA